MTRSSSVDRLWKIALERAQDHIGGMRAFYIQSTTVRRALVAEAILDALAGQDDEVQDSTVRGLIERLQERLNDSKILQD